MLKDLQLVDGDLVDDANGSLVVLEGTSAVIQSLKHSLKLFLGEFFLEPTDGIDWFGIVEKPFAARKLRDAIIVQLTKEPSIESIESLTIQKGAEPRSVQVDIVIFAGGERIQFSEVAL